MKKSLLVHIAVMVVAAVAGYLIAIQLTADQETISPEKKDLTKAPIAGFHKITSDVKWMLFIQHLGSLDSIDEKSAPEVNKRLEELIKLDPNFEPLYKEGVLSLSSATPDQAVKILDKACHVDHLKTNWQIPFYAGFVLSHYSKPADYAGAANYYMMAIQRSGDKPESYIISNYLRSKAKALLADKDSKIQNENYALLKVLYDEWTSQAATMKEMGGAAAGQANAQNPAGAGSGYIPDIVERLLKAAQELKNSESPTAEDLAFVAKVRGEVLAGQHLCDKCLTPYGPGEKFCGKCGSDVKVYGICAKCGAVVKGDFCSSCGTKVAK